MAIFDSKEIKSFYIPINSMGGKKYMKVPIFLHKLQHSKSPQN